MWIVNKKSSINMANILYMIAEDNVLKLYYNDVDYFSLRPNTITPNALRESIVLDIYHGKKVVNYSGDLI